VFPSRTLSFSLTALFSQRTQWDTTPGSLAHAWDERQRSGLPSFDLTASNPTVVGFKLDLSNVAEALAAGAHAPYQPTPFGLTHARTAVAAYYQQDHGLEIALDRILLTVSTSEAYSYLFRLLCDPGDNVLYCQPGYPLFDYLASMDNVELRPVCGLQDGDGWHLDRAGFADALTPRTKAVLVVHPNNPTGHFTSAPDRAWLDAWCAERGLALIVDEVFLDYRLEVDSAEANVPSFLAGSAHAATFVLSGISKISGLPQMKAAWIVLHGPQEATRQATQRLDVIADTFLSVSTPLQCALPALLDVRQQIQPQILTRLRRNLQALDRLLRDQTLVTRMPVEGGWYATLRIPALEESEESALRLVREAGVYVHPGVFFGFAMAGIWVVSLLTPTEVFEEGIARVLNYIQTLE